MAAIEIVAKRVDRTTRQELFVSLLGKSQTFHNRQQVGDLMARATNDVRQINLGFSPGVDLIFDSMTALVAPFVFIAVLEPRLLLSPVAFLIAFVLAVWLYMRKLTPVSDKMRAQFGTMNAGLKIMVEVEPVWRRVSSMSSHMSRSCGSGTSSRVTGQVWGLPSSRPPSL